MKPLETIYLIHHSHTDIGFTHDQPILWEMERRFIDTAIDACERQIDLEGVHTVRWTVETVAPLLHWLKHSSDRQIERFLRLEKAKRIEVMAMYANITPLMDTAELLELFQPLQHLRQDYGLTIRHAMNCDVNGQNWGLVDVLIDAGIEGFSMAINQHAGGAPLRRPNTFWWEAPSGRRLLTYNGWHYMTGNELHIGDDIEQFRSQSLPSIRERLDTANWPLPFLPIQITHPFGDNGSVNFHLSDFIQEWNARGDGPQIRFATYSDFWTAVQPFAEQLPVYRGDWTDYWNFGSISSARETQMNRASRARLISADKMFSGISPLGIHPGDDSQQPATDVPGRNPAQTLATTPSLREQAWTGLYLWDEHTWGADISIRQPENEDTAAQWNHKAAYAYQARSLSLLLQRDAVGELSLLVPHSNDDALILFNPLPWRRTANGPVSKHIMEPRGLADDPAASRHHQDRAFPISGAWLKDIAVPAMGYTVVRRDQLVAPNGLTGERLRELTTFDDANQVYSENAMVENEAHRILFDRTRGGIQSWFDKRLQRELVDPDSDLSFGGMVYERVANVDHPYGRRMLYDPVTSISHRRGWKPGWRAERWGASRLLSHKIYQRPTGIEVIQMVTVEGVESPVSYHVFLPNGEPWVEFRSEWLMGLNAQPDATYIAMPFAMPDASARIDLGGQAIRPEADQIPGSCRDYFTVQNWVDLSAADWGVTIACPDNPMVQLGDFHFAHNLSQFELTRPLFLGWVTNNYWETNFRAYQPGKVGARYVVLPHAGAFDEAAAHRFGSEASSPIVIQSAFEPTRPGAALPREASLLILPEPPILVLHLLPDWATQATVNRASSEIVVRLLNASDEPRSATIGSGLLAIVSAHQCDLFGTPINAIVVTGGNIQLELPPRRVAVLRLDVTRSGQ